jgi:hypothetical protein
LSNSSAAVSKRNDKAIRLMLRSPVFVMLKSNA